MARLHLTTLGRTELTREDGGEILSVLAQPKRFALLVYLAIEGSDGFIRRDTVAALFWPEHDQADARANLRKSLYFLRQSLGQDVIVTRGDEEVGVDPSRLSCDVLTLLSGGEAPAEGPFLEGFHFSGASHAWEEWLDGVRVRVRAHAHADAVDPDPRVAHDSPTSTDIAAQGPVDDAPADAGPSSRMRRWRFALVGAGAVAVLFAAGWRLDLLPPVGGESPTRYDRIRLGTGAQFPMVVQRHYALPPDGTGILFLDDVDGVSGSWWKPVDAIDESYLPGLDVIFGPTFSPEGDWVAFTRGGQLFKRPLTGEPPVLLADSVTEDFTPGLDWLPGGHLVFEDRSHNLRISRADGGPPELVASVDQVGEVFQVSVLPAGDGALVVGCAGFCEDTSDPHLSLVDFERETVRRLRSGVWMAWPMADGRVVMIDGRGTVFAAPFDRASATLGHPVPLLEGIRVSPFPDAVMGRDGSLLYIPGGVEAAGQRLVWVDRQGVREDVDPNWPSWGRVRSLSLSSDDRRLAVGMRGGEAVGERIWIKDLPAGALTPLTAASIGARRPVWSPDNRTLGFIVQGRRSDSTWTGTVNILPADASSTEPEPLLEHERIILEVAMTPDWNTALVRLGNAATGEGDIAFTALGGEPDWKTSFRSEANEYGVALAPDGRWVAYVSEMSGRPEVYVRPFPGPGPRTQVSQRGGVEPRWAHSGGEIFYRTLRLDEPPDAETLDMVSARVSTDPTFRVESRRRLFSTTGYERGPRVPLYDVASDDRRFLMVTRFTPRGWTTGDVIYSRQWYWSDQIQAKLQP